MQEFKARLAAIVDSSADAIIGTDLNGLIVSWNHGAEAIYGYSAEEVIGKSPNITHLNESKAEDSGILRLLQTEGTLKAHESIRRCKDGRLVHISGTASPIRTTTGKSIGTSFIERDISDRILREKELKLALEKAEAAVRAKGEFVANISHELRTPMNAIIGMLELTLRNGQLSGTLADYLETACDSAHLLLSLVNDLLDFSRLERGGFELDVQEFSLKKVVDDSMRALALRANDHGLELAYRIDETVPDMLCGDPRRLRQILLNLVGNGIKFTEKGEVVIWIHLLKQVGNDVQLKISVSDSGIGIAAEDLERIFHPFTQLDTSPTRKFSGAGLGLTICRDFVELMGGEILVDSQVNAGTTVHVTPWLSLSQSAGVNSEEFVRDLRGLRVLIVDDNATNRQILEEILKYREVETVSVASGSGALDALKESVPGEKPFDMILVDSRMPDMDGTSLIRQIRGDQGFPDLSILMLTCVDRFRLEEECQELRVAACLEKPISENALLEAMIAALRQVQPPYRQSRHPLRKTDRPLKILVAEDTIANQKVVRSILESRGHTVVIASNGNEAVVSVQSERFDLILMDIQMPALDGLQATRILREDADQSVAEIPIVALTAHAMKVDRIRCLEAGMNAYLSKPFEAEELVRTVETTPRYRKGRECYQISEKDSARMKNQDDSGRPNRVVDLEKALERLGGDRILLRQMAEMYLEDIPQLLKELKDSVARKDAPDATRAAHSIAGLSSTFEAQSCQEIAKAIENCGQKNDLAEAVSQIPALQDEFERVCEALKKGIE